MTDNQTNKILPLVGLAIVVLALVAALFYVARDGGSESGADGPPPPVPLVVDAQRSQGKIEESSALQGRVVPTINRSEADSSTVQQGEGDE
ncbi:MAG: hypothetical protein P1U64_07880 [Alcanivoracaceae bacterium]|nr:hypothetical protein [Alcanivoracaceae bacterium]